MTDKTKTKAERVALRVAEIPDRFSPEDQPEMMLVTRDELIAFIEAEFDDPPGDAELLREVCARFRNSLENGARANGRDTVTWRDAADALDAMAKSLLAAAPADKPDEPAQCNATMQRVGPSGWVMCNQPAGHSGPHRSGAHVYPQDPAPADERERRIARWRRMALREPCLSAASECDGYWLDDDEIDEAIAIMRTAPDSDAALRAERAEAEVARLRAECERLGEVLSEIASNDEIDSENAKLRIEVERLTKERDEARAQRGKMMDMLLTRKARKDDLDKAQLEETQGARNQWDDCVTMQQAAPRGSAMRLVVDSGEVLWKLLERNLSIVERANERIAEELDRARGGWEALERLRDEIQRREEANQQNFKAGVSPCKDPAVLLGCTVANQDTIERIGDLLASRPAQGKEGAAY